MDREESSTDRDRTAARTDPDDPDESTPGRRGRDARLHGPIEPEPVNPEHAAFVLLGALLTVVVLVSGL